MFLPRHLRYCAYRPVTECEQPVLDARTGNNFRSQGRLCLRLALQLAAVYTDLTG